MKKAAETLESFEIPFEVHVLSAHRTPLEVESLASGAKERGIEIFIAGAGMAAHLPGVIAAMTPLPVIGVPLSSTLHGIDALLAMVQMPPGVPVATVGIDGAVNAALLAVQMLSLNDGKLQAALATHKTDLKQKVLQAADQLASVSCKYKTN
jgi:5-(carboxyamino)imidazole ribonucleotide mutase